MRALITGASGGIGRAVRERFGAAGYETLCPSREEMDLRSPASIRGYMAGAGADALVCCAGVLHAGPAGKMSDAHISETLQVNLAAPLMMAREALPRMRGGRMVCVGSVWGSISRPGRAAYSASKAGLDGLTRALALEFAGSGVLVNSVAPGYTDTDMARRYNSGADLDRIRKSIPLGRLADPRDVAEAVFFLGSEQNRYVTGQVLAVDGGFSVQ